MKQFGKLLIVLALLSASVCKAQDAGLCKSLCVQEKRQCRTTAMNLNDHEGESMMELRDKSAGAREYNDGGFRINQAAGPTAAAARNRKFTRTQVCEQKAATCSKACTPPAAPVSDVLVKPAS